MWRILAMVFPFVCNVVLWTSIDVRGRRTTEGHIATLAASICAVVRRLVANEHALDIVPGRAEQEGRGLPRNARDVRGEEQLLGGLAGEREQGIVGCRWLGRVDVDRGPAEPARLEMLG